MSRLAPEAAARRTLRRQIEGERRRRNLARQTAIEGELLRRLPDGRATAAHRARIVAAVLEGRLDPEAWSTLAEDAEGRLAAFVQQGWHVLHPGVPLDWSWYHGLICSVLERVTLGELLDVLICIPPGFAKSMLVSVYWPAWHWLQSPSTQFITLSSSGKVASRDSKRMRDVITSPWFVALRAALAERDETDPWGLSRDQNQKVHFENTARGHRACFATGGSVTGERADIQIIDDPHQIKDVMGSVEQVAAALGKAHEKVDVILPTRFNDRRTARRVTILQRVHDGDVAKPQIEDPDVYKVILPMHAFELDDPERHPDDPRAPGELLDPVRMPEEVVQKEARKLERKCPGQARAQHEMRPVPAGGGTFQRAWMTRRYTWDPQRPVEKYHEVVISVDATFGSKTAKASHVSMQAWGRHGWIKHYLLDEVHLKLSYIEMRAALRDLAKKWNAVVLVEVKALGQALVEDLQEEIPSVIAFNPDPYGGKESRAQLATPYWQGGNVWLPDASWCPWIGDWCNDVAAFPATTQRDRVDTMSQYFLYCQSRRGEENAADHGAAADALEHLFDAW